MNPGVLRLIYLTICDLTLQRGICGRIVLGEKYREKLFYIPCCNCDLRPFEDLASGLKGIRRTTDYFFQEGELPTRLTVHTSDPFLNEAHR